MQRMRCTVYGKSCIYEDLPRRARPSRSRIAQLEEENDRLKRSLVASLQSHKDMGNAHSLPAELPEAYPSHGHHASFERHVVTNKPQNLFQVSTSSAHPPPCLDDNEGATPSVNYAPPDAVESRFVMSAEAEPRYHGPTSTLFEDGTGDRRVQQSISSLPRISTVWVQKGVMAEAACQRHLEMINLRENIIDFDGVDPDLGMHFINLHWNRQHHAFLITYRPAFMRDMACKGPYFSKLLLNAIYFGASKFSSRLEVRHDLNDVRTAGWLYQERVILGGALDRSDITTFQALLVIVSSLFALGDERSAAWLYAGTAFRMIIDLGNACR
ncbi:hypothetical protein UA08_08393 [Talaromyces atroroseus]|uniref:Xylanolytic transcriptional activator regulatory domain-containing protein n=1 Tax=Talaromyces atroroseus TaxID=1441469 RepID=A0A1Q5Q7Z0_TALAT|nr:hypothetical protein UA08_08393 [Talaromyces atroroseus]OKL56323.1 hypothetical protein UA08_08393 [Talaromyces atroroseus]